jgi:hypothetical protein
MPEFIFTIDMTSPRRKPPPTSEQLRPNRAPIQATLRDGDESATVTDLRFFTSGDKNMIIVEGTTDDMDALKSAADDAEANGLAPIAGWVTDGPPAFPDVAPDAPGDPEAAPGGRRRRKRRTTRRHRKRRSTRR